MKFKKKDAFTDLAASLEPSEDKEPKTDKPIPNDGLHAVDSSGRVIQLTGEKTKNRKVIKVNKKGVDLIAKKMTEAIENNTKE